MRALNKTVYVKIEHILIRPQIYVKNKKYAYTQYTRIYTHIYIYSYIHTYMRQEESPEGVVRTWRNNEDTHARTQTHLSVQNCTKVI